jgi:hypothetical protein
MELEIHPWSASHGITKCEDFLYSILAICQPTLYLSTQIISLFSSLFKDSNLHVDLNTIDYLASFYITEENFLNN